MGYIAEGSGKNIECWRRFMSLPVQDQANMLHGIRDNWTMSSEIINALMLRETANQRTTMERWIVLGNWSLRMGNDKLGEGNRTGWIRKESDRIR